MKTLFLAALFVLAVGCATVERKGTIQTPPVEYVK